MSVTDRQTTDGRATAYSEPEREFSLAKNRDAQNKRPSHKVCGISPEAGRESVVQGRFVKEVGLEPAE